MSMASNVALRRIASFLPSGSNHLHRLFRAPSVAPYVVSRPFNADGQMTRMDDHCGYDGERRVDSPSDRSVSRRRDFPAFLSGAVAPFSPTGGMSHLMKKQWTGNPLVSGARGMATQPNGKRKYEKEFRGSIKGICDNNNRLAFGTYGLQVLERGWIKDVQIEAGRRAITRTVGRSAQLWIRIFPHKPITAKPTETRMGKGKGAVQYYVAVVKQGKFMYELSGVPEKIAREAFKLAGDKMHLRTRFVIAD